MDEQGEHEEKKSEMIVKKASKKKRVRKRWEETEYYNVLSINKVESEAKWVSTGVGEIIIDSTAEESVCPREWGKQYPMRGPAKWLNFTNARGGHMKHYGERRTTFRAGKEGPVLGMVQKPLAAVWRIADKGNRVCVRARARGQLHPEHCQRREN